MSDTITVTDNHAQLDLTFKRGDTFLEEFAIEEENVDTGELEPVDLTGSTFSAPIVDNRGTVLATLTLGSGITVFGDDNNKLRLHVVAATTAGWTASCPVTLTLVWTRPTTPVIVKTIIVAKL